jgi:hypothetical protein
LQRRRRQSTQIIKKKNLSSTYPSYPIRQSLGFNWKRFISWIVIITLLGVVSYSVYFWSPEPAGSEIDDQQSSTSVESEAIETAPPEITQTEPAPFEDNIQIEVLNGCGFNGVAKIFQDYLRSQGFDVVNTDNFVEDGKIRWDIEKSMVIDRIGQIEQAMAVARSLAIPVDRVMSRENPESIYDVSVVIGKDFKELTGSN